MSDQIKTYADVRIIDDPEKIRKHNVDIGKPYLEIVFDDGSSVMMSFTLAEMIGGVGAGANLRYGFTTNGHADASRNN